MGVDNEYPLGVDNEYPLVVDNEYSTIVDNEYSITRVYQNEISKQHERRRCSLLVAGGSNPRYGYERMVGAEGTL